MLGNPRIVMNTNMIPSSISSVKNLPPKKATSCINNAVLVGVGALNTHFLFVAYEKSTAKTVRFKATDIMN